MTALPCSAFSIFFFFFFFFVQLAKYRSGFSVDVLIGEQGELNGRPPDS